MKRELKFVNTLTSESGEQIVCFYSKIISLNDIGFPVYGVGIEKQHNNDNVNTIIADITVSEKDIDNLLELLVYHEATPLTLKDIVIDWISSL